MADFSNPLFLLNEALEHAPESVHIMPFAHLVLSAKVKKVKVEKDGHRPEVAETGRVLVDVPAMVARSLRKPPAERDFLMLVHVRREVVEELERRAESGIVLPGVVRM